MFMKKIICLYLFGAFILRGPVVAQKTTEIIPLMKQGNVVDKEGWELCWGDEFNDTLFDAVKWWPQTGTHGTELQYYTPRKENVYVKDGLLHLRAIREKLIDTLPYTSGNVFSSIEFGKGHYFEVRCKIPKGRGLWPAFWFWSGRNPKYQEIDVLEYWCDDTRRFSVANYWQDTITQETKVEWKWIRPRTEDGKRLDMSEEFAIYAVFWDDEGVRYLLNNRLVAQFKNNVPLEPFPIILNLAVDRGRGRERDSKTIFPAEFLIDYVRVYKRKGTQPTTRVP